MLKKLGFSGLVLALALGFTSLALAATVDVNGYQVDTDTNTPSVNVNSSGGSTSVQSNTGSVNINSSATGTNVQTNTGSGSVNVNKTNTGTAQINVNGTTVNTTPTSVQVNRAGESQIDITQGNNALDVMVNGADVKVTGNDSLSQVVPSATALDDASANVIVNLGNGTASLIKTDNDLGTYASVVAEQRPGVEGIAVNNGNVSVTYQQPARLFGIFGSSLKATVVVDSQGQVNVKLPWYSFFYTKNTAAVKSGIETNLSTAEQNNSLDLLGMNSSQVSVKDQNGARVINVASDVVNQNATSLSVEKGSEKVNIDYSNGININVQR